MFNRSRRNLAYWFTLSMGSILLLFAGVIYYQRSVARLRETDHLLYHKASIMAANVEYNPSQGDRSIDLSAVPILGNHAPPLDSNLVDARWYTAEGQLRQFYGTRPPESLQFLAAFETLPANPEWLRQLTLPVEYNGRTIGYLQVTMPLSEAQNTLKDLLLMLVFAVPITLGVISLVGWFLGGLAMRPIQASYHYLQRFTSDASHELRAPLAAILSNAQVALLSPVGDGPAKHGRLGKIAETAKLMNGLIGDLLFLARQSGRLDPDSIQSVRLQDVLKDAIALPSIQAAAAHVNLSLELPDESILAQGNPDLLRQAIANLLSNACKYTPAGGRVWLRVIGQYHRSLIQVEDTGMGIAEADIPHIFERFYRVDRERARDTGGSGLGLAIAQQIVEAHHGRLTVLSQVGRGSLFQIELPPV